MRLHRLRCEVGYYFIITSSLNSLLPTRARCGCVNIHLCWRRIPLVLIAGIQNRSCKSANSFFHLTRSQSSLSSSSRFRRIVIVIIILSAECRVLENFKHLSLMTGTNCKMVLDDTRWRGLSSGTTTLSLGTLPLPLWPIALRDTWRNVFSRQCRVPTVLSTSVVCL